MAKERSLSVDFEEQVERNSGGCPWAEYLEILRESVGEIAQVPRIHRSVAFQDSIQYPELGFTEAEWFRNLPQGNFAVAGLQVGENIRIFAVSELPVEQVKRQGGHRAERHGVLIVPGDWSAFLQEVFAVGQIEQLHEFDLIGLPPRQL